MLHTHIIPAATANTASVVVSPEYQYHRPDWRKLRDVLSGQREVKRQGHLYLRSMPGQDSEQYATYLDGAVFFNMVAQARNAMLGQVFHRDPVIAGIPERFREAVNLSFAKDGSSSHIAFCRQVVSEQIGMGRYGVLVDAPAISSTKPTSYVVGYAAENILDWTVADIGGVFTLTRVLLREFSRDTAPRGTQDNPWIGLPNAIQARNAALAGSRKTVRSTQFIDGYTYKTVYRELLLEQQDDGIFIYKQNTYDDDPNGEINQTLIPNVRGAPLNFIPFQFFGATSTSPDCEKSPLLDIAELNISHYRTYAELEHGRRYTALPVYYAPGKDDDGVAEYHIGPNVVWEVPEGMAPGILEYKGEGLNALVVALDGKERQIAAIGGRLMAGSATRGSESIGQTQLREANEQALILNVVQATEPGMAQVTRWWLMWRDIPLTATESLEYNLNRDFVSNKTGAREIRALQMLHEDGLVPIEVLYNVLIKVEWIDATTTIDEFKKMLADPASFPNNPDALARQGGFTSRQQQLDQTLVGREG